ncbi:TPA: hypothetical protein TT563_000043 [Streptococcus equi subsp. zooepidemicus]|nr:hypothetical protein [Streptococcus equi subsp. zooepidemicus]
MDKMYKLRIFFKDNSILELDLTYKMIKSFETSLFEDYFIEIEKRREGYFMESKYIIKRDDIRYVEINRKE